MSLTVIDGSCLQGPRPTGVAIAVHHALKTGQFHTPSTSLLVTYGNTRPDSPLLTSLSFPHRHISLPSKLVHAAHVLAKRDLSSWIPQATRLLLPNLNITHVPRVPYDLCVHDLSFLIHPPWFSLKSRLWHALARPKALIRGADRLFTVSERSARDIHALTGYPLSKIERIDLTSIPQPIATKQVKRPFFLAFGGGDARKNLNVLLQAFYALSPRYPEWELRLLGTTSTSHPKIRALGYVSPEEKTALLQEAAALLYPSWYEGFGIPPQEAFALGTPCLLSSMSALPETAPPQSVILPPFMPHLWYDAMRESIEQYYASSSSNSQNSLASSV